MTCEEIIAFADDSIIRSTKVNQLRAILRGPFCNSFSNGEGKDVLIRLVNDCIGADVEELEPAVEEPIVEAETDIEAQEPAAERPIAEVKVQQGAEADDGFVTRLNSLPISKIATEEAIELVTRLDSLSLDLDGVLGSSIRRAQEWFVEK